MATPTPQKSIHTLIVDTGPLIRNTISISTILATAEEIYTTPAVLQEIRDPATRARVETTLLPFLKVKAPTPASYEAVAAFSKKTGDFPVLSRQDLGILALAYEIHCQKNGGDVGLRRAPRGEIIKQEGEEKKGTKEEDANAEQTESKKHDATENEVTKDVEPTSDESTEQTVSVTGPESSQEPTPSLEEDLSKLQVSEPAIQEPIEPASQEDPQSTSQEVPQPMVQEVPRATSENAYPSPATSDDDSDGGWITPHNLKQHQAKDSGVSSKTSTNKQMDLATMTTDFAMQNVLLQMNLSLLSPQMQRITKLRSYILRCHACFLTTKEMTKQFCPRCGQPTLKRVSCSTSAKGEFRIHLSKNFQYNKRGDKYSVPKPVAGTASGKMQGKGGGKGGWGRDLVLAEDQKEYLKHAEQEKRLKTRDLMDEDYLPGILTGDRGRQGGRMKVGAGKNVNSRKKF